MSRLVMEVTIAEEVSSMMAANIGTLTPQETAELYFVAIGACLAELYEESTATGIQELAAAWARFGFLEANRMNFHL